MWQLLRRVGEQSIVYGLGNVATAVLAFLLLPLYAYKLTPGEFGVYALMTTVYAALAVITDCGTTNSIARYYFDDMPTGLDRPSYNRRLLSSGTVLTGAAGIAIGGGLYVSAAALSRPLFAADYTVYLRLVAITVCFRGFTNAPMAYLRVTERAAAYSGLVILQMASFLLFNLVFVLGFRWGVEGILCGQLVGTAVWAVAGIWAVHDDLTWRLDPPLAGNLLSFGLPFLPALLCLWAIELSDRYLLSILVSAKELGLYSLGYKVGQAMYLLVTAFTLGWGPLRFKILQEASPKAIYVRVANIYVAAAGFAWLALGLFAADMIRAVAAPAFHSSEKYVSPVAFGYLLYGLFVLTATGLGVAKRSGAVPSIAVLAAIVNVVFNIELIPTLGAIAAAYSTLAAYGLLALGALFVSQRVYPIPYEYRRWAIVLGGMAVLERVGSLGHAYAWPVDLAFRLLSLVAGVAVIMTSGVFRRAEVVAVSLELRQSLRRLRGWSSR